MARSTPICAPAIPQVPEGFNREEWLEAPECIRCHRSLSLNEGCEWPEDPRLLLCSDCLYGALETALKVIDNHDTEIKALQDDKDQEISELRSDVRSLEARVESLREQDRS